MSVSLSTAPVTFLPTPNFYTVEVGSTAVLGCKVKDLEGKSVSSIHSYISCIFVLKSSTIWE